MNEEDVQLLKKAAEAAGYTEAADIRSGAEGFVALRVYDEPNDTWLDWNPLNDPGQALELSVRLKMDIMHYEDYVSVDYCFDEWYAESDELKATCRAIVRCAAGDE